MASVKYNKEYFKRNLTPQEFSVLQEDGTEPAFNNAYHDNKKKGIYYCRACGCKLFYSEKKFDSGTGWPSFSDSFKDAVIVHKDTRFGMVRDAVACARCGSHLGHVFDDGPKPTGKRYCMNSIALNFKGDKSIEKAIFSAGCFWHVQDAFSNLKGVIKTTAGYTDGNTKNPTYEQVSTGTTGHAESVLVEFDASKVSYDELLDAFWNLQDPTQKGGQGPDIGSQYRSAIFYYDEKQMMAAEISLENKEKILKKKIQTEITKAGEFYAAEKYHQDYFKKNKINACPV